MEMELKLLAEPEARRLVERHPAFRDVEPQRRTSTSTYYDTADLALYRLGAVLRVRQSGRSFIQTVKLDSPADRMGSRGEWEWPLPSAVPDLEKLGTLPDEAAVLRAAAPEIAPLFKTIVERTSWLLRCEDGTTIEAVFDEGMIRAGDKSADISEVELELKSGSAAQVFRLAIDLAERADLRFGSQSKSERGFRLVSDSLPDRPQADALRWDSGVTISAAFPALVHSALRELAAESSEACRGDVEGIHRMRAAIRKLRSILVLFRPYLARKAAAEFNDALGGMARVLGRGRDWDVFVSETLVLVEDEDLASDVMPLREAAEVERAAAHAAIAIALRSQRTTGLILGMGAWTQDLRWLRKVKPDTPFADLAPDLLDTLERKVRKRAKRVDEDEDLHDLRKALKKLRYSVEYAASLFEGGAVRRYHHAIKEVLATLGNINDAVVSDHHLAEIATLDRPDLAPAAATVSRLNHRRREKALGKLPKVMKHLQGIAPFWA